MAMLSQLLFLLAASSLVRAEQTTANPIRRVVTMLQAMQKKVTQEGETEKDLYDKFMCYCKTGTGDLQASIGAAEEKIPQVTSDIEAAEEDLKVTKEELKQAQVDRTEAKKAMAEATGIREKESAAFDKFSTDTKANIAAIRSAVTAIEKGMKGGFLQTSAASTLRHLVDTMNNLVDEDRQTLGAFLAGPSWGAGYVPQSGQITGILKTMDDEMSAALHDAIEQEESRQIEYKTLMKAKNKEVAALTDAIETKTKKIGDLGVAIVQMKDDLDDTQKALADDKKFLADLEKGCATKTAEWQERCKTRSAELLALSDTIKLLNDDDALELFKKTLPAPSASLMQLSQSAKSLKAHALSKIRRAMVTARGNKAQLDLIELALSGKKVDFSKVIKMIDDMVALLKTEQNDDNDKKEYCEMQFDTSDDKKKALERDLMLANKAIDAAEKAIATTTDEIAALNKAITDLDKAVMEATVQRRDENADFNELISSDTAAKELLLMAKNRLNKFYNPKLYLPPAKKELSAEGAIERQFSLADVSAHSHGVAAPPPPPETWGPGGYNKKGEESSGVIAMVDLLIGDLDKEMTEAKAEEKDAQGDYEQMMQDSAAKRAADSQSLTDKIALKADLEAELNKQKGVAADTTKELYATLKYISSLHAECDWLIQFFDVRKEARTAEIQSLVDAKAVLSGADFALLQIKQ